MKAFVETLKGSTKRTRYDETTFKFKESFEVDFPYPYDYGFIIGTNKKQNDCIDCYILSNTELKEGDIVDCSVLGMFEMLEDNEIDHKVLLSNRIDKPIEIDNEIKQIQEFIKKIFKKFPEVKVKFGRTLEIEETQIYIMSNS